jgi:hypothetical protein
MNTKETYNEDLFEKQKAKVIAIENENYMQKQTIRRLELEIERLHGQCFAFKHALERSNDVLVRELATALRDFERMKK